MGGKKLYETARQGKEVERQPRSVTGGWAAGGGWVVGGGGTPALTVWGGGHLAICPEAPVLGRFPTSCPPVSVSALAVDRFDLRRDEADRQSVHFSVVCSKGTYIRSLAADLGRALGSAAHLTALRREAIGEYRVDGAWQIQQLAEQLNQQRREKQQQQRQEAAAAGEAADAAAAQPEQAAAGVQT